MKRVVIFKNGSTVDGKVIAVTHCSSLNDILQDASRKLGFVCRKLYTPQGGLIDEVCLIREDDVLYVAGGEPFKPVPMSASPAATSHTHPPSHGVSACSDGEWITLNVGGKLFSTTRSTLTQQHPDSMLSCMFTQNKDETWCSSVDENGAYLVDRSPQYFEPILNYLRHGRLVLDKNLNPQQRDIKQTNSANVDFKTALEVVLRELACAVLSLVTCSSDWSNFIIGVLEEAKFFGLTCLIEVLEEIIEKEKLPDDSTPIGRREMVLRLLATSTDKELRCQGMNFTGANLTKLDLRYINFKYAILRHANLSGANLSYCNFERADLSNTVIESANLLGVKMSCVNLEGASLKGCNFEDPAGSRANIEGGLMKNVNLEGSHMAGVNLRVANLKNANLQNCDLRGAVLAGADLENCDLSGCDLQEANLRGANLKMATFELMLNPLHMAQAV